MKVLIVDDEMPARQRLRLLLDELGSTEIVGEAGNGMEALRQVQSTSPDVVLLDIRMPGMSGLEVARHLDALEQPPAVIFATAYDEYAVDAFDAHAVGYVLKPVRRERLEKALQHAARLSRQSLDALDADTDSGAARSHLCARVGHELKLIPIDEVICFLADQKYVRVTHAHGDNLIDDSLKSLETEYGDRFVRIHRSALVAINRIEALEKSADGHTQVRLRDIELDEPLTISRRHLADVRRRLKGR